MWLEAFVLSVSTAQETIHRNNKIKRDGIASPNQHKLKILPTISYLNRAKSRPNFIPKQIILGTDSLGRKGSVRKRLCCEKKKTTVAM